MNKPPKYPPDTTLTVGSHQVSVIKFLSEGGFAQVYVVNVLEGPSAGLYRKACMKRVVVPNKQSLNTLRAEVDCMKLLKGNRHVVTYLDSHASRSTTNANTYEVFVLMEYCSRGGLIDFLNTRLQNRLTEHEVLDIMSQTTQAVAAMHKLLPPLLHRDIKIENVLVNEQGVFKLCDFGSVCGVIRPPTSQQEMDFVYNDIMHNTTAQYRSPEMVDLNKRLPIDEKSDIWALGVYLYKLCYYTTPFENNGGGDHAILQGRFQFPALPHYSDHLKSLIGHMLRVNPTERPNVYQVLNQVSNLQGVPCPITDFYKERALSALQNSNGIRNAHSSTTTISTDFPTPNSFILHQQPMLGSVTTAAPFSFVNSGVNNPLPLAQQQQQPLIMSGINPQLNSLPIIAPPITTFPSKMAINNNMIPSNIISNNIQTGEPFKKQQDATIDPFNKLYNTAKGISTKSAPSTTTNTGSSLNNISSSKLQPSLSFGTNSYNPSIVATSGGSSNSTSKRSTLYVDSEVQTDFVMNSNISGSSSTTSASSNSSDNEIPSYVTFNNRNFSVNNGGLDQVSTGGSFTSRFSRKLKSLITGESLRSSSSKQNTGNNLPYQSISGNNKIDLKNNNTGNSTKSFFKNGAISPIRKTSSNSRKSSMDPSFGSRIPSGDTEKERVKEENGYHSKRRSVIIPKMDPPAANSTSKGITSIVYNNKTKLPSDNVIDNNASSSKSFVAPKKSSIEQRVQNLLSAHKNTSLGASKTTNGYGKYVDQGNPSEDSRKESVIVTPLSATGNIANSSGISSSTSTRINYAELAKSKKKKKLPPPKPKKPKFLHSSGSKKITLAKNGDVRSASDTPSELVTVDVDKLEEDFKRRFPSTTI
ncbi:uncharacterized protein SCDLUD_002754 [Saccharomycodes ludwigii]|uniref:uncharacterized protein n=1 Tax=Saccharomycodes ludwigii TaxID=36035 RepID=UPI001E87761C|nr:hypothetical protein SCDLUD_002754 [Saccharomycodes ludwigii]KAH3901265.1 hypothetical protein SCDLUD_002754 [Saccharomycodes ludwigii]